MYLLNISSDSYDLFMEKRFIKCVQALQHIWENRYTA